MRERETVRVLLQEREGGRWLLMRGSVRFSQRTWYPIGGGLEARETPRQAALREIAEETGIADAVVGDAVWSREAVFELDRGPVLFRELFLRAECWETRLSRQGWTENEQSIVKELRWWSLDELAHRRAPTYPPRLRRLLASLPARGSSTFEVQPLP